MKIRDNLNELINDYLTRTKLYKRKGTYDYYKKTARGIKRAFEHLAYTDQDFHKKSLNDIVCFYKEHTIKKNSQINADLIFLSTVLNYYHVKTDLPRFEKLPDDTVNFRPLSDEILDNLMHYLKTLKYDESNNLSWRLAIYLMLDTGVRMNELLQIKSKNVDLLSNSIILDVTKNGKKRVVFFDTLSKEAIKLALKRNKEYIVWNDVKNIRLNRVSIFCFMNKIALKVNSHGTKIHCHRLRKTFATKLLKMGCPITTIQKLLGHIDIKMTMIYLEIDTAMIEKDYFLCYPYKKEP